ncbi:MAG: hypothetical protein COU82_00470 [Candidatus Portnoybacteria bacterium CG10_big_fil_rev_8_21_14_0_10_38_18]|uniref:Uncharacterized protein n=1 Tax=Candidatus Portnoybacteria bacterium CG10_big_fil_rev_8_21_14_0_10_38_18 TaxID=1974813 RepID=A0A2M8KCT2_9BACT|nr:MAG: hypothetical protein COU82_00470 [Candidatus Portnoybacteria bacterium CG10_big_fil_rev_8_21_14_0_10_38_18]
MSLKGLKLAALYSYDCRKARMLKINEALLRLIQAGENREEVAELLKKLVSYDWYHLIAKNNDIKDPFAEEVVRAYWTGNKLTKLISVGGKNLFLFHNFTVLVSPMPNLSSGVPDLASRDECKISWGMVEKITDQGLIVDYEVLIWKDGGFDLTNRKTEIKKGFLDEIRVNDWVSFHINLAREQLTEEQVLLLHNKTKQAIDLFNGQQ